MFEIKNCHLLFWGFYGNVQEFVGKWSVCDARVCCRLQRMVTIKDLVFLDVSKCTGNIPHFYNHSYRRRSLLSLYLCTIVFSRQLSVQFKKTNKLQQWWKKYEQQKRIHSRFTVTQRHVKVQHFPILFNSLICGCSLRGGFFDLHNFYIVWFWFKQRRNITNMTT